jgi:hypothetical protein
MPLFELEPLSAGTVAKERILLSEVHAIEKQ